MGVASWYENRAGKKFEALLTIDHNIFLSYRNAFPTSAGSTTSATGYGDSIKRTRHQTPHGQTEKSAENVISFTPINASSRLVCPFKDCHRNTCVPKRTFARADNLGSHLRNVHGLRVPARARVRKWIGLTNLQSAGLNNFDGEKMRQLFATVSGSTLGGSCWSSLLVQFNLAREFLLIFQLPFSNVWDFGSFRLCGACARVVLFPFNWIQRFYNPFCNFLPVLVLIGYGLSQSKNLNCLECHVFGGIVT